MRSKRYKNIFSIGNWAKILLALDKFSTTREIYKYSDITPSCCNVVLNELVEIGLVEKTLKNKRSFIFKLTEQGKETSFHLAKVMDVVKWGSEN